MLVKDVALTRRSGLVSSSKWLVQESSIQYVGAGMNFRTAACDDVRKGKLGEGGFRWVHWLEAGDVARHLTRLEASLMLHRLDGSPAVAWSGRIALAVLASACRRRPL